MGGNILGPKSVARIAKLEKTKATELATNRAIITLGLIPLPLGEVYKPYKGKAKDLFSVQEEGEHGRRTGW